MSFVEEAVAVANTVAAGVQSVQKAAQIAEQIQSIIIRPPAEWKLVTQELLVPAGRTLVESAVAAAQQHAAAAVGQEAPHEFVEPAAAASVCAVCGSPLGPGAKFCEACGAAAGSVKEAATKSFCPSCGREVTPGKKFCGSCGHKLG